MSRAEYRRIQREQKKENKTYTFTHKELEQLEARIREEERQKQLDKTKELAHNIFKMMLVIPCNVLEAYYWNKTAKQKMPKFVEECLSLYDAFMCGAASMETMQEYMEEMSGIKLVENESNCYLFAQKVGNKN